VALSPNPGERKELLDQIEQDHNLDCLFLLGKFWKRQLRLFDWETSVMLNRSHYDQKKTLLCFFRGV